MARTQGLLSLLQRSAELLDRSAEEIRTAHTINGRWPRLDEYGARRDFRDLREIAKRLRKVAR